MVYRIYTEKKKELAAEAKALLADIGSLLQIKGVTDVRVINRYDAENITKELFDYAVRTVFSEPQLDITFEELENDGASVFAVEYLPGQFDQRADSAAQCIQLISQSRFRALWAQPARLNGATATEKGSGPYSPITQ